MGNGFKILLNVHNAIYNIVTFDLDLYAFQGDLGVVIIMHFHM